MLSTTSTMLRSSVRRLVPTTTLKHTQFRGIVTVKEVLYTAKATATGQGRDGHVESEGFKLDLATPKELGGKGLQGKNPEQLFAMGYSGCLLGAIQLVARRQGKPEMAEKAVVHADVKIGPADIGGLGLSVDIKVEGVDEEVLKAGHEFCPYSRALTKGISVNVSTKG